MTPTTASAIAELEDLPTQQLIERYEAVFREPCRSRHKRYLIRRLAWRLQAEEEGIGLSRQAKKRAAELGDEKELRVTPPRENAGARGRAKGSSQGSDNWDPRIPPPGNWLRRQYNGNTARVLILQDGFVYEDEKYSSLSAVAIGENLCDHPAAAPRAAEAKAAHQSRAPCGTCRGDYPKMC